MKVLLRDGQVMDGKFVAGRGKEGVLAYQFSCDGAGGEASVPGYKVRHRAGH